MTSEIDKSNMISAVNQWKKLLDLYADIETKKNADKTTLFSKPYFKIEDGVFIKDKHGSILIESKCLACEMVYNAIGTNLHKVHLDCEESKKNYAIFSAEPKMDREKKIAMLKDCGEEDMENEIAMLKDCGVEDMEKEKTMLREELKKVKDEKDEIKKAIKLRSHENEILWRDYDWFKHEMLRSKTQYPLYDDPNQCPGLLIVYRMMFKDKKNEYNMKFCKKHTEELTEVFKSFSFIVEVVEVESSKELSEKVNAMVRAKESKLQKYQSLFVFVLSHGRYDGICDSQNRIVQIQRLRKSLIDCDFLLNKPKVLVLLGCQHFKAKLPQVDPNGLTPTRNCLDLLEIRSCSPGQKSCTILEECDENKEEHADENTELDNLLDLEMGIVFLRTLIAALKCNSTLGLFRMMFLFQQEIKAANLRASISYGRCYNETPEIRSTLRGDVFFKRS